MKNNYLFLTLLISIFGFCLPRVSAASNTYHSYTLVDEYDELKSAGDNFFDSGEYKRARLKYLACLEVPGYNSDNYASNRALTCQKAIELKSKAEAALSDNELKSALEAYEEIVLYINPQDQKIKKELGFIYDRLGDTAMNSNEIIIAKDYYQKSLRYFPSKLTEEKIQTYESQIAKEQGQKASLTDQPLVASARTIPKVKPGKKFVPVIASTTVGLASFIWAESLNKTWNTHLADLSKSYQSGNSSEYKNQYQETSTFHSKQGLRNALMVTSGVALLADIYFLLNTKKRTLGSLHLHPAGFAATLTIGDFSVRSKP